MDGRAVATDWEGAAVVAPGSGSLSSALRATMAIPGVFQPTERDSLLLADGGLLNNVPALMGRASGGRLPSRRNLWASEVIGLRRLSNVLKRSAKPLPLQDHITRQAEHGPTTLTTKCLSYRCSIPAHRPADRPIPDRSPPRISGSPLEIRLTYCATRSHTSSNSRSGPGESRAARFRSQSARNSSLRAAIRTPADGRQINFSCPSSFRGRLTCTFRSSHILHEREDVVQISRHGVDPLAEHGPHLFGHDLFQGVAQQLDLSQIVGVGEGVE